MNKTLESLIKTGLPVTKANFHQAVNNSFNQPETQLTSNSQVESRRAEMFYTPSGLVCFQNKKHFIVPLGNIISVNLAAE